MYTKCQSVFPFVGIGSPMLTPSLATECGFPLRTQVDLWFGKSKKVRHNRGSLNYRNPDPCLESSLSNQIMPPPPSTLVLTLLYCTQIHFGLQKGVSEGLQKSIQDYRSLALLFSSAEQGLTLLSPSLFHSFLYLHLLLLSSSLFSSPLSLLLPLLLRCLLSFPLSLFSISSSSSSFLFSFLIPLSLLLLLLYVLFVFSFLPTISQYF